MIVKIRKLIFIREPTSLSVSIVVVGKMARRKKDDDYGAFQATWTEEFACEERAGSALCLIRNDKIASLKRSNIKRHFDTRNASFALEYPAGNSRKKASKELQRV